MKRILAAVVLAAAAFACWADSVSVSALGTSLPLSAGPGAKVTLVPSGGTARVEYTTSNLPGINNGTAVWNVWPSGAVSTSTNDTAAFQVFVRAVGITGAASMTVDAADPSSVLYVASRPWGSQLYGEPVILCKSAVAAVAPLDTAENTLGSCTIPAGAMGANGILRITLQWTVTNSGNAKNIIVRFSGTSGTDYGGITLTTSASLRHQIQISNRGLTNSQVGFAANQGGFAASTGAATTSAVDTTSASTVLARCNKATGSENCTLESFLVELLPSP